jgi:hypothetical protein
LSTVISPPLAATSAATASARSAYREKSNGTRMRANRLPMRDPCMAAPGDANAPRIPAHAGHEPPAGSPVQHGLTR